MVNIRTERTRYEIEKDWTDQGFDKIFEKDDEQIWTNEDRDELFYTTWMNGICMVFKHDIMVYI